MRSVLPADAVARYLFSDKVFAKTTGRIKYNAFLPRDNENKVSVFCISGLRDTEIWDIGKGIAQKRETTLKGSAHLEAFQAFALNLKIEPDEPPERHANIIFPQEKSEQKLIAKQLANISKLYVF